MTARKLDKSQWRTFFDRLSKRSKESRPRSSCLAIPWRSGRGGVVALARHYLRSE